MLLTPRGEPPPLLMPPAHSIPRLAIRLAIAAAGFFKLPELWQPRCPQLSHNSEVAPLGRSWAGIPQAHTCYSRLGGTHTIICMVRQPCENAGHRPELW